MSFFGCDFRAAKLSRAIWGAAGLLVSLAFVLALNPVTAQAKMKQPACGKFQKQAKKSKGNKKRIAKFRLKQCKADRLVYGQLKNVHLNGYRTDGELIDNVYCANGNWQADISRDRKPYRTGWRVTDAKVKNRKNFTAAIEGKIKGGFHVIGVERRGNKWFAGWEYNGTVNAAGEMKKSSGRSLCAKI